MSELGRQKPHIWKDGDKWNATIKPPMTSFKQWKIVSSFEGLVILLDGRPFKGYVK